MCYLEFNTLLQLRISERKVCLLIDILYGLINPNKQQKKKVSYIQLHQTYKK